MQSSLAGVKREPVRERRPPQANTGCHAAAPLGRAQKMQAPWLRLLK